MLTYISAIQHCLKVLDREVSQEKEFISFAYNSVIIDKRSQGDFSNVLGIELDPAIKTYDEGATFSCTIESRVVSYIQSLNIPVQEGRLLTYQEADVLEIAQYH